MIAALIEHGDHAEKSTFCRGAVRVCGRDALHENGYTQCDRSQACGEVLIFGFICICVVELSF